MYDVDVSIHSDYRVGKVLEKAQRPSQEEGESGESLRVHGVFWYHLGSQQAQVRCALKVVHMDVVAYWFGKRRVQKSFKTAVNTSKQLRQSTTLRHAKSR